LWAAASENVAASQRAHYGPLLACMCRRTYHYEAIRNEAKPRGLKRIKSALKSGPKDEGETEIEVAV
jgi:hypothetical protein